jgi:ABC-type transporter Mla subunit MlaD
VTGAVRVQTPHRARRALDWILDHPWYLVLVAAIVVFVNWALGTRSEPHHVRAEFTSAFNLVSGLPVDVDGLQVGKISGVRYDNSVGGGAAIVDVGISDSRYWPLHQGTTVASRWGSTIGNGTRRLDLLPGPDSAPVIANGGVIQTHDTLPAVDLDQVLNVFTGRTRGHLTRMLGNLDAAVNGQSPALHDALSSASPAVASANGVLSDLQSDSYALQGLITGGDQLTSTLASRAPAISDLVTVAGQTFATLAGHAGGLERSIHDLPGALSQARGTLVQLDSSVGILRHLVTDIAPGAAKLAPLAVTMQPALAELRSIVPTGVATLVQATRAAPSITSLLHVGTPLMPRLQTVTSQLAPMVACMRPYAPELGGAIVGANSWVSTYVLEKPSAAPGVTFTGAQQGPYVRQHGIRAMPQASAATVHAYSAVTTPAFVAASGKQYAEPRPPGLSVGQPWFLPQCGAGPNSVNPAADPENRP